MRLVVELDHEIEGEEYEEVLAFYEEGSALRRWLVWRCHDCFGTAADERPNVAHPSGHRPHAGTDAAPPLIGRRQRGL